MESLIILVPVLIVIVFGIVKVWYDLPRLRQKYPYMPPEGFLDDDEGTGLLDGFPPFEEYRHFRGPDVPKSIAEAEFHAMLFFDKVF